MTITAKTRERKTVELGRKRIPFKKLFDGKEIREAAKALEDFRLHFNEQEILYGAKLTVRMGTYYDNEASLIAARPETDKEYDDRIEKAERAAELKAKRAAEKKEADRLKAIEKEANRQKDALDKIREVAKANGLTVDQLKILLDIK
jgi:hypothetical protein